MKSKEYIIEFTKLRKGENEFTFIINDKFLADFEGEHAIYSNAEVKLILFKTENMYDLSFDLTGTIRMNCDVCLDDFDLLLNNNFHLIMKISEVENYSDDEIIYIKPNTLEYDLKQYLYESVLVSLPIKKVCSLGNKECNSEVLKKIEELKTNTNEDQSDETDPRWDNLKGIFNN